MKTRIAYALICIVVCLPGCGGDGGGAGSGTVSMDIADAKPFIAGAEPEELWVVFEEVLVHKSGGGWASLDLPETPYAINLLAFSDGQKTKLATPTVVTTGHITQFRFMISEAYMVFPDETIPVDLDVPSGTLKTDKQFDWWLEDGGAVYITAHFDLSRSIVETGPDQYKLKPVIHLFNNNPQEAATICGNIDNAFFGDPPGEVLVTVIWNGPDRDEAYTTVTLGPDLEEPSTDFCIFWLVPLEYQESYTESYTVEINSGLDTYSESVEYPRLVSGDTFMLNNSELIGSPPS
ncbi:MAG: DUF4382 domain-containing protein [Deltaproteobacteria bacterium]|jgi:hypothetical protein